jgi:hypothetical protein
MNLKRERWVRLSAIVLAVLLLAMGGSNSKVSASTAANAAPTPPDELPAAEHSLTDTDASLKAMEKRVLTGDTFFKGLYERPFTSIEMVYQEDVDIRVVTISQNDTFYFFTIELHGVDSVSKGLMATYGIEFDRTKTGRGDLLVWAHDAKKEWSMDNLKVFSDPDKSVGGPSPLLSDKDYTGNGYEQEEKLEGDNAAYARIDPKDETIVQFAVTKALLGNPKEFLWGAWADKGWRDPLRFDYNDHILENTAGSPIKTSKYYPVKELFNLDNTCRLAQGFTTKSTIRGMCDEKVCKAVTKCALNRQGVNVCTTKVVCT